MPLPASIQTPSRSPSRRDAGCRVRSTGGVGVRRAALVALLAAAGLALPAAAAEFSVSPIRAELKPGTLSETITVTNDSTARLRVSIKLMEWTQDAEGKDVYKESNDLVYFPRQMEIEPQAKRLVRIGARTPAGPVERTYRLFIEEEAEASPDQNRGQVAFVFRFAVPVFLPPALPKPQPEVGEPTLAQRKLTLPIRNAGNQHFRLSRVVVSDGATFTRELPGWYSLANSRRIYSADIPPDICRAGKALTVTVEGEGVRVDRKIDVDPKGCQ